MFRVILYQQATCEVLQTIHTFSVRDNAIKHAFNLIQFMGCSSFQIKNIVFNGSSLLVYSHMPVAIICEGISITGAEKAGPFFNNFFEKEYGLVIPSIEA